MLKVLRVPSDFVNANTAIDKGFGFGFRFSRSLELMKNIFFDYDNYSLPQPFKKNRIVVFNTTK